MVVYVQLICRLPQEKREICVKNHDNLQMVVNSSRPFVRVWTEIDYVFQMEHTEQSVGVISNDIYGSVRHILCLFCVCLSLSGVQCQGQICHTLVYSCTVYYHWQGPFCQLYSYQCSVCVVGCVCCGGRC